MSAGGILVRYIGLRTSLLLSVALLGGCGQADGARPTLPGNPERGKIALTQYACHACHIIPGIAGSKVYVGPPLGEFAARRYIAGQMPNSPDNLVRWIVNPQQFDPATAMPAMGVTERDARDMTAYLWTLR